MVFYSHVSSSFHVRSLTFMVTSKIWILNEFIKVMLFSYSHIFIHLFKMAVWWWFLVIWFYNAIAKKKLRKLLKNIFHVFFTCFLFSMEIFVVKYFTFIFDSVKNIYIFLDLIDHNIWKNFSYIKKNL